MPLLYDVVIYFLQMPTVTQNMSMPGTNTAGGVYSGQKSAGSNTSAGGSSYYGAGGNNTSGYDDSMSGHSSSDYNKYNSANKQSSSEYNCIVDVFIVNGCRLMLWSKYKQIYYIFWIWVGAYCYLNFKFNFCLISLR